MSFTRARAASLIAGATVKSRRLIVTLYLLLFVGLGTGAASLLRGALQEYDKLKEAEASSQRRLAEAQTRLAEQEKILARLRSDPEFVEKVMRQRGYAKPGDLIFRFEN